MRCDYIERRENILLIGGSGSGKTHLATTLASEACGRGKRVRFFRVTELATQLLEAREERQLSRLKSQLAKLDLLVLDELGYVPASKIGAELLFDVISTAYERSSVIVTTNLPFEQWPEVHAERAADRGGAGPADAPLPDPGDGFAESYRLRGRQAASPIGCRSVSRPRPTKETPQSRRQQANRQVTWESGVAHFTRPALHFPAAVHTRQKSSQA